jgi:GWxTD domain-containing protein
MLTPVLALALLLAGQAQEPPEEISGKKLHELLEDWPEQYVRWIITSSERKVYASLETDEDRLRFIEFFWSRRDPDPQTSVNEFRRDYLERYAFVMNRLSAGKPGWATDRGRLYLILGPPHAIQRNPMGRYGLERPSEIWTYNNLDIPGFPASLDFEFVDFNGTGDFELVQDIDTAASVWNQFGTVNNALDAIAQRRNRVGEVDPMTNLDTFRNVDSTRYVMQEFDLQRQLTDIYELPERSLPRLGTAVASEASFGDLSVTAAGGAVWGGGERARVPVQLTVPYRELSPRVEGERMLYALDYMIAISKEDGAEVSRAEDALTLSFAPDERDALDAQRLSISATLDAPAGTYRVVAYIRDRQRNWIGDAAFTLDVPEGASEAAPLALSSVFVASELLDSALAEDRPFQFGGVRVIPSTSRAFAPDETLKVYLEAYGASSEADGRKRLRVDFFVMRDGRLFLGVPASHLRPEAEPVGITGQIPLRKCEPGDYVIRVRVTDEVTGARAESESSFSVSGASASSG